MNTLILSASIGSGHTKAAESLQKIFGGEVEVVDFMAREVSFLNWLTKKIYLAALRFIPDLYDRIYNSSNARQLGGLIRLSTSALMYLPFVRLLKKFSPAVVICTHPFPEAAASLWKFLHPNPKRNFLLATVLTDYSLHEIWIYKEVDAYFVATDAMKLELAKSCHAGQKIFALGIPIGQEFANQVSGEHSTPTILMMGGGLGLGAIEETLRELLKINLPLKVVVVAGKNKALIARLKKIYEGSERVEILGYVENISELMSAADLLITKPGALTITEAFAAGLPLILHAPIPGPEALNAEYAVANGAAISVEGEEVSEVVEELIKNSSRLIEMRFKSKALSKVNAAADIVSEIKSAVEKIF